MIEDDVQSALTPSSSSAPCVDVLKDHVFYWFHHVKECVIREDLELVRVHYRAIAGEAISHYSTPPDVIALVEQGNSERRVGRKLQESLGKRLLVPAKIGGRTPQGRLPQPMTA